ncbi:MAG: hypothetical protein [Hatfieldvirus porci]|uniref:Uncharacterized protein n=1 Tax=phage Lak_Megaphage_RVC_JS4_GC31 TaxID=3109228 RepID=A0ABZ0Z0R9_9CAUD|nr:MAG: hypothetical protein [phage Lak_Megaphage_RVC_AP3_GC31]WQJ52746.1 MAG: hypothetical protein [phage Lak_Megaphage_RVC_JS4_GC31]
MKHYIKYLIEKLFDDADYELLDDSDTDIASNIITNSNIHTASKILETNKNFKKEYKELIQTIFVYPKLFNEYISNEPYKIVVMEGWDINSAYKKIEKHESSNSNCLDVLEKMFDKISSWSLHSCNPDDLSPITDGSAIVDNKITLKDNTDTIIVQYELGHNSVHFTFYFKIDIQKYVQYSRTVNDNDKSAYAISVVKEGNMESSIAKKELKKIFNEMADASYKVKDTRELYTILTNLVKYVSPKANANWIDLSNLTKLPPFSKRFDGDISRWNTHNIKDMSNLFSGLDHIPGHSDITKWDVSNVINITSMFNSFSDKLAALQVLKNWHLKPEKCSSVLQIYNKEQEPYNEIVIDLSNFDFSNTNDAWKFLILKRLPHDNFNVQLILPKTMNLLNCSINNLSHMFSGFKGLITPYQFKKWQVPVGTTLKTITDPY